MSVHGGAIAVMSLLFLPTVSPNKMNVVTEKSGHEFVGMAVSVCLIPGQGPVAVPYPSTGTGVPRLVTIPTRPGEVAHEVPGSKVTVKTDAAGTKIYLIETSPMTKSGTYMLATDVVTLKGATVVMISGGTVTKDLGARSVAFANGLRFRRAATHQTAACTPPPATLTAPYVASFSPADRGGVGTEIMFRGQNFSPDHFIAMIGDKPLTITSRTASEIRAKLPAQPIRAPLVVGYCSDATNYVLSDSFAVLGEPVITSVTPTTFHRGDLVTVTGKDLEQAGHANGPPVLGGSRPYVEVLLHDTRTSLAVGNAIQPFLEAKGMTWSSDGKKITFRADQIRTAQVLNPQPSTLAGKLRLVRSGATSLDAYTVASPLAATWAGLPQLSATGFSPWTRMAQFGGNFMILGESSNRVTLEGQGMFEGLTTVALAGKPLQVSWSNGDYWDGHRVSVDIPPDASAGRFTVKRGSASVETAPLLLDWVPKFMPETQTLLKSGLAIRLGQTYELRGWHLKATGVPGLTYTFSLTGMRQTFLALEILEHTESRIRFRVNPVGTVPTNTATWAQYATKDWTRSLQMDATFNGVTKPLFEGGGFAQYTLTQ